MTILAFINRPIRGNLFLLCLLLFTSLANAQEEQTETQAGLSGADVSTVEPKPTLPADAGQYIPAYVSYVDRNALFDGAVRHMAFGIRSPEDLKELLPELSRLARGKPIRIVWVDAGTNNQAIMQEIVNHAPEQTVSIDGVSLTSPNMGRLRDDIRDDIERLPVPGDLDPDIAASIKGIAYRSASESLDGYEQWVKDEKAVFAASENEKDETNKALETLSATVAWGKTSGGLVAWIYKAWSPLTAVIAEGSIAKLIQAMGAPIAGATYGAFLDYWFARNAVWYADAKRKLKFNAATIVYSPWRSFRASVVEYAANKLRLAWNKTLSYVPRRAINAVNTARPFVKSSIVDQTIGLVNGFIFAQLANWTDSTKNKGPFESFQYLGYYLKANVLPAIVGSGGDCAAASLCEKKVISETFKWGVLQGWGMSFYARNMLPNLGFMYFDWAPWALFGIVTAEVVSKVGFIAVDAFLEPQTEETRHRAQVLGPVQPNELRLVFFGPGVPEREITATTVLSGISSPQDIGSRDEKKRLILTRKDLDEVIASLKPEPKKRTWFQYGALYIQRPVEAAYAVTKSAFNNCMAPFAVEN